MEVRTIVVIIIFFTRFGYGFPFLINFFFCLSDIFSFFHGLENVLIIWIQVVIKAQKVKLRIPGLLSLKHDLKWCSLLTDKFCCAFNDGVHFGCCGNFDIRRHKQPTGSSVWLLILFRIVFHRSCF